MYRVILVDDEYMIHLSLNKLLQSMNNRFTVVGEAEDGKEALQLISRHSPDIIITDICMPEMDGLELIETAKQRNPQIKFVILSGYSDFEYAQKAIRYGVSDFLLKPIVPEQFFTTLTRIFNQLEGHEKKLSHQNDWLLILDSYQQKLFEYIWTTNQDDAIKQFQEIVDHFNREQTKQLPLPKYLGKVLNFLDQELKKKKLHLPTSMVANIPWANDQLGIIQQTKNILFEMIKEVGGSRNFGSRHNILKAVRYIDENFSLENISLQDVAKRVGVSESYFSRTFKDEMNISFIKYLIKKRMEKAKELLDDKENRSTIDIAYNIGYTDYPHFSKTFKKYYGLTPSEYRKQILQRQSTLIEE